MSINTVALIWGSGMVAFAPLLCMFFQIAYPKSQLIIVVTTAAFFFLLSALCSSIMWSVLDPLIGLGGPGAVLIPGIIFQFCFRCCFVALYHRIERIIKLSLERSEAREHVAQSSGHTTNLDTSTMRTDVSAAKLKLELNDASCGLAAGIGFGGMHAILLYGTLLASEATDYGALHQPSCPHIPTLVVSALHCFFFYTLDTFYMLCTFFGMRRRLMFPRGGGALTDMNIARRSFGSHFGDTRAGGNAALIWVIGSHVAASAIATFNAFQCGCAFLLTLLSAVASMTVCRFWSGVSHSCMPEPHSTARLSLPASFSHGSCTEAHLNNDDEEDDDDDDAKCDGQPPTGPPRANAKTTGEDDDGNHSAGSGGKPLPIDTDTGKDWSPRESDAGGGGDWDVKEDDDAIEKGPGRNNAKAPPTADAAGPTSQKQEDWSDEPIGNRNDGNRRNKNGLPPRPGRDNCRRGIIEDGECKHENGNDDGEKDWDNGVGNPKEYDA